MRLLSTCFTVTELLITHPEECVIIGRHVLAAEAQTCGIATLGPRQLYTSLELQSQFPVVGTTKLIPAMEKSSWLDTVESV